MQSNKKKNRLKLKEVEILQKPKYHIFVCTSSRVSGQQKGFCHTKASVDIVNNFLEEIRDRELGGEVIVSNTGCFALCEKGPIVIVYPDNVWYGRDYG